MTIDYGFKTTDEVQYDSSGLPVGIYKVLAKSEEADDKGRGVIVEYEILDGEFKGKTAKVWYLTTHENQTTANIAKQNLKRIADATGKPVSSIAPLKNRVFTVEVRKQKKDDRYTEISRYLPESHVNDSDSPF